MDTQRYLHTVGQTSWHCQPKSVDVRSTPSCAEATQWQWVQNRTKRKCLNLGPFFHQLLFHSYGLWCSLVSVNSFSFQPPWAPSPPLCHFNRRIFTFNTNPKGGSARETRVQSITHFSLMFFFTKHKCFIVNPSQKYNAKNKKQISCLAEDIWNLLSYVA